MSGEQENGIEEPTQKRRRSSHHLRITAVSELEGRSLLEDSLSLANDNSTESSTGNQANRSRLLFLQRTLLNPKLSFRTQLMLSFGVISFIFITFVEFICMSTTLIVSYKALVVTQNSFEEMAKQIQSNTVRYISESLAPRLTLSHELQLIYEATRDRFAGYPASNDDGDNGVPYFDMLSNKTKYPIQMEYDMPLDWQIQNEVHSTNYMEHLQKRYIYWGNSSIFGTSHVNYHVQGACDPTVTDPNHYGYYENCTIHNNNMTTGGVVKPTTTNKLLYEKSSSLAPLLKSLFEYNQDITDLGVYFFNDGAGSFINYPMSPYDTNTGYTSIGCEWMAAPNPFDPTKPIGTTSQIKNCHPKDAYVSNREYNPMERDWCRISIQEPNKNHLIGPYMSNWIETKMIVGGGKAIYDRITNQLIGCIWVGLDVTFATQVLQDAIVSDNSHLSIVRLDEKGAVLASSAFDISISPNVGSIDSIPVGVTHDIYQEMARLFDDSDDSYNSRNWDPEIIRDLYENYSVRNDGFVISCYPMPPPPTEYQVGYKPQYLAIISIWEEDYSMHIDTVSKRFDRELYMYTIISITSGIAGFVVLIFIIVGVSNILTGPLQYMNEIATAIAYKFGETKKRNVNQTDGKNTVLGISEAYRDKNRKKRRCCSLTPKTEITEVVNDFEIMISSFSGSLMAKDMKVLFHEVKNLFEVPPFLLDLYRERKSGFEYQIVINEKAARMNNNSSHHSINDDNSSKSTEDSVETTQQRMHLGKNICQENSVRASMFYSEDSDKMSARRCTSPLFLWILILIIAPMLIITIGIAVVTIYEISFDFPKILDDVKQEYIGLQISALGVSTRLRAQSIDSMLSSPTRNLHILTRYTNWIFFGGMQTTDAFIEMKTGAEECKTYPDLSQCQFVQDLPCDCKWNFRQSSQRIACRTYPNNVDTRYLQHIQYTSEFSDASPVDGNRKVTSYPKHSTSPNNTVWWNNIYRTGAIPGYDRQPSNTSNYDTLYDRLRALSSIPIFQSIFNHAFDIGQNTQQFIGMEDDGTMVGYYGCRPASAEHAHWQSSAGNRAAELRPELCPLGKYGYDPRCRAWYDEGRRLYQRNETYLHISLPYMFSDGRAFGQTYTAPLFDPNTNEHIGQIGIDFLANNVFAALSATNTPLAKEGFPILITPETSKLGDTIVGPNFSASDSAELILDLVFSHDASICNKDVEKRHLRNEERAASCDNVEAFENIVAEMKLGRTGTTNTMRTKLNGSFERLYISYAPVKVIHIRPVNSSDFSRGIESTEKIIYSLSLVETEEGLLESFSNVESNIQKRVEKAFIALIAGLLIAVGLVAFISDRVAVSVVMPMIYLKEVIRKINKIKVGDELPIMEGGHGCAELSKFSRTLEALFRTVRCANVALFTGDIEKAYAVSTDALRVFKEMDNEKAIGVVANNLGNICLVMYRIMEKNPSVDRISGLSKQDIASNGVVYFSLSIQIGEKAYNLFKDGTDENASNDDGHLAEGWTPSCLDFMQHLSNRYFNRAMFLLSVKDSHDDPEHIQEMGFRDLEIVQAMDEEIVSCGMDIGWKRPREAELLFDAAMSRIKGHLSIQEMGYPDDWNTVELLEETFQRLKRELLKGEESDLFDAVTATGRAQQIENELIRFKMLKGDVRPAALIAIRMLVEDDFVLEDAQLKALEVLLQYLDSVEVEGGAEINNVDQIRKHLLEYQTKIVKASEEFKAHKGLADSGKLLEGSIFKLFSAEAKSYNDSRRSSAIRESNRGDITMELF